MGTERLPKYRIKFILQLEADEAIGRNWNEKAKAEEWNTKFIQEGQSGRKGYEMGGVWKYS